MRDFHHPSGDHMKSFFSSTGSRYSLLVRQFYSPFSQSCAVALVIGLMVGLDMTTSARAAEPLGFAQALNLAAARSRALAAQDSAVLAAKEMAGASGQLPDPVLKLGINNLPINGDDQFSLTRDFMTMRSVGVMQEFTRGDKRRARASRFEREAETAIASRTMVLANLQRDTAQAWLNRYYQERLRALLVSQRDEAKLQIEAADTAYRTGRGSQADGFAARSAVAQIEDRMAQSERQMASANTRLARWVGTAEDTPSDALPNMDAVPWSSSELPAQLAHHPELALMEKQEQVAAAEADIARANKKPDWAAELMFNQRGPAYSNMVSINFSVPLQWDQHKRQDRELAAKQATVEQLRAQREEATREQLADIQALLQEWHSNRARMVRFDNTQIPLAKERTQAALTAYRGGGSNGGTLTAVLEARRMELDTRMERIRLEMETALLWAQLNYLTPANAVRSSH
jgi:outer membrane protein TolC